MPRVRRVFLTTLVLVSSVLVAFAAGAIVAMRSNWGDPTATVVIRNESGRALDAIRITFTTCGMTRTLIHRRSAQPLLWQDSTELSIPIALCGEGSHTTEVVLSDGHILTSEGSYIEGGYVVTERITSAGIVSGFTRTLP